MSKYTKEFETWYESAYPFLNKYDLYMYHRIKDVAYNAWKAALKEVEE